MDEHRFELVSPFSPTGDQPQAIDALCEGILEGKKEQVLEGATGTGKTFTMANIIARMNRPTLVFSHNKTLAGQLYLKNCFRIIVWNSLFLTLITINRRLMFLRVICILKKQPQSMKSWICSVNPL